jgi:hypothetical protein
VTAIGKREHNFEQMTKLIKSISQLQEITWQKCYVGNSSKIRYFRWESQFILRKDDKKLIFECWTKTFPQGEEISPEFGRVIVNFESPNSPGFNGWFPKNRSESDRMAGKDYLYLENVNDIESIESLIKATQIVWQEKPLPMSSWQQDNLNEIVLRDGWKAVSFPNPKFLTF